MQDLSFAFAEASGALQGTISREEKRLRSFVDAELECIEQDEKRHYRFRRTDGDRSNGIQSQIASYRSFFLASKELERSRASRESLPRMLFMALGAAYDSYLRAAVKSLLYLRPDVLERSGTNPAEAAATPFGALQAAREYLAEQEAERLAAQTYPGQLAALENAFGIPVKDELLLSPDFVQVMAGKEVCARQNGLISEGYLKLCAGHGAEVEGIKPGDRLTITQDYFCRAYELIYEAGVKLGHLLWRGVVPQQVSEANASLQELTFSLIQARQYPLASKLLSFANTGLREHLDDNNRVVFLFNSALTEYLAGNKDECSRLLNSEDWSTRAEILQLACCVLHEHFEDAANLMRRLGRENRPSKAEYLRWPLFEQFRKTEQFSSAFKDVFGEVTLSETEVKPLSPAAS
ncbi:MAG: hypothetical protein ACM3SW_10430 [Actinomycetota bacterium]